jgi:hypothetical protein
MFFAWRVWALGRNTFWKSIAVVVLVVRVTGVFQTSGIPLLLIGASL